MVTFNQSVELGVANGQLGRVQKVQFPKDVTWKTVVDPNLDGNEVEVPSRLPEVIFVTLNHPNSALANTPNLQSVLDNLHLPPGTVPIFIEQGRSDKIKLGKKHSVTVKVSQFPIVPAFSLTIHKIQGQTLNKVVIGSFRNRTTDYASFSAIYVALSRARKLEGLLLLEPFDDNVRSRCSMPEHLARELHRLRSFEFKNSV